MKKLAIAATVSLFASAALAGGLSAPIPEPVVTPVEVEAATSSAGGILLPLFALVVIAAALS